MRKIIEVQARDSTPRRRLGGCVQALNNASGILDPGEAIVVSVNEHLVGLEPRDAPEVRSPIAQAPEVDRLAGMHPLTDGENALRIPEHMGDRGAKLQQLEIGCVSSALMIERADPGSGTSSPLWSWMRRSEQADATADQARVGFQSNGSSSRLPD
jgi:hypothetical protein